MDKELEEAAENYSKGWGENDDEKSFISGGKWMEKRMFSKEEVRQIAEWSFHFYKTNEFDDSELEEEWYKLLEERFNLKWNIEEFECTDSPGIRVGQYRLINDNFYFKSEYIKDWVNGALSRRETKILQTKFQKEEEKKLKVIKEL